MDYFFSKTQDSDLWMGHNLKHGWVIFDRLLPANKASYGGNLFFIKCSDWSFFKDKKSNWKYPEYPFVVTYLQDLEPEKQKESEQQALDILEEFINKKRDELRFNYIQTIHNNYLEEKGLPPRKIVKATRRRDSVCWKCKDTVDNKYDAECSACGWIICSNCGACKQFGCI